MFKFKKAGVLLLCLCMLMASMVGCQSDAGDVSEGESGYPQENQVVSSVPNGNQENSQTLYTLYKDELYKLYDVGNGMVTFTIRDGYNLKVGFADLQGNVMVVPKTYIHESNGIPVFFDNCVKILDGSEGDEMIIDKQGNVLFEHQKYNAKNNISDIGGVSEGYFWVETFEESLAGKTYTVTYYSAKDFTAVATFEDTRAFPEESYLVQESGRDFSSVQNGMAYLAKGNMVPSGLIHAESAVSFKMSDYDEAYIPSQSAKNGNWTLDLDTIEAFEVARYKELIAAGTDKDGKLLGTVCLTNSSNTKYYAIVDNTGKVLLDAQTNIILDSKLSVFNNGLCVAMDAESESWGYINAQGQWVIQPQYTSARPFASDGYAVVNDIAVIDEEGKLVLAPAGYSVESVTSLEGKYDYDYGNWTVYLTFNGNEVSYYQASSYSTTSWKGTYVIKGGKITFEGNPTYGDILCCGKSYSFSAMGDTITINGKQATLIETKTN